MNPRQHPERDQKIVTLRKQGVTFIKLGEMFNISRERVRQIVSRHEEDEAKHNFGALTVFIRRCCRGTFEDYGPGDYDRQQHYCNFCSRSYLWHSELQQWLLDTTTEGKQ